ncbi:MAG: long-chain fatty acid--CoA ligase [Ardenticatenaceae bacterium]|nr:long-chain fatty acid--CoA ligase [Ardenticatenaceae bacterium]
MNVSQNVERARRFFPEKPALIYEDRTYTYAELDDEVNRVGNALRSLGVERGDRVGIYLPNIPTFPIAYYAVLKIGAIAVSLSPMLKRDEVRYILSDSGASALFTAGDLLTNVPHDELPDLQQVIVAGGESGGYPTLDHLTSQASAQLVAAEMEPGKPAAILYTSGTTGFPKGATLSHGNIVSNMYSAAHHTRLTPDDRLILFLPLFHVFGQNFVMNGGFTAGATIVLHRRFEPEAVLNSIQRNRVTCFYAVPTIYIVLLNMDTSVWDLSSIRYYFTAAATMPREIALRWKEKTGLMAYEGYGLTECSPFASYNHDFRHKFGSIGSPVENVEMKVVDEAGQELSPGEWGEIIIRGPGVMLGYWNKPEETDQAVRNGWLHSGDIGTTDEEGYFYIVDRVKDMVNVAGFKVFPAEVENVIYRHAAVKEVGVYGKPDPIKGETVVANVVLKDGADATAEEIIEFVRERLAVYKAPREVNLVSDLPKSATGKILKRVLRAEAS